MGATTQKTFDPNLRELNHFATEISNDEIKKEDINQIRGVDSLEKIDKNLKTIVKLKKSVNSKIIIKL